MVVALHRVAAFLDVAQLDRLAHPAGYTLARSAGTLCRHDLPVWPEWPDWPCRGTIGFSRDSGFCFRSVSIGCEMLHIICFYMCDRVSLMLLFY